MRVRKPLRLENRDSHEATKKQWNEHLRADGAPSLARVLRFVFTQQNARTKRKSLYLPNVSPGIGKTELHREGAKDAKKSTK